MLKPVYPAALLPPMKGALTAQLHIPLQPPIPTSRYLSPVKTIFIKTGHDGRNSQCICVVLSYWLFYSVFNCTTTAFFYVQKHYLTTNAPGWISVIKRVFLHTSCCSSFQGDADCLLLWDFILLCGNVYCQFVL